MKILAIQLAGTLQSWGVDSRYKERRTQQFPTKSGVIGILASAMGITREETKKLQASGLNELDIVVRVEKKGKLISDFHTIGYGGKNKKLSNREYLSDAVFLVGLYSPTGDDELLEKIEYALNHPQYILFLGRKSCVPSRRISREMGDYNDPRHFLETYPLILEKEQLNWSQKSKEELALLSIVSTVGADTSLIQDAPLSFSSHNRSYQSRSIKEEKVIIKNPYFVKQTEIVDFDPLEILE